MPCYIGLTKIIHPKSISQCPVEYIFSIKISTFLVAIIIPSPGFPGGSDGKKNTPAMQETWVQSLGWEDTLQEGMATYSNLLVWRIPSDKGAWRVTVPRVAESWTWLRLSTGIIHSTYSFLILWNIQLARFSRSANIFRISTQSFSVLPNTDFLNQGTGYSLLEDQLSTLTH